MKFSISRITGGGSFYLLLPGIQERHGSCQRRKRQREEHAVFSMCNRCQRIIAQCESAGKVRERERERERRKKGITREKYLDKINLIA